jgi:uncharacterized protein (DUF1501 family)
MQSPSRRDFLRRFGGLTALGTAAPFALNLAALGQAAAQSAGGYKALVCLYLAGGNDTFNTVLCTDAASWDPYVAVRSQAPESIALLPPGTAPDASAALGSPARLGGVWPITPLNLHTPGNAARSVALHPQLGALATMFGSERRLAIVSNVGPLVEPLTKAQYDGNGRRPPKLFSHNDQTSTWQALGPEGTRFGWGGRLADLLMAGNRGTQFTAISTTGAAVWLAGEQARQYQISSTGAIRLGAPGNASANPTLFGSATAFGAMQDIARGAGTGNLLERDLAAVVGRSIDAEALVRSSLGEPGQAPWGTAAASYNQNADPLLRYRSPSTDTDEVNPLAQQFQVVARMIAAQSALGVSRQVFLVNLGGFDTHDSQNRNHARLMARLAHGLQYFDGVLGAMPGGDLRGSVTTFTASDFGRTFTSNGDGTDHGWGAHHFVMGGAVRGGDLYGRLPVIGAKNASNNRFDASADQLANGVLLPQASVEQYGATLARWFGASDADLATVFPALSRFGSSSLGFMV